MTGLPPTRKAFSCLDYSLALSAEDSFRVQTFEYKYFQSGLFDELTLLELSF